MAFWGSAEFLVPRLSSSNRFAIREAGEALSILCDEAALSLRKEDGRCNAWWSGSLAFPIDDARRVTVSFTLLLERQSDDDEATLVIDTEDAAVIQPG